MEPLSGNVYLGSDSASKCFNGIIQDPSLFLRPLEGEEIKELYSNETAKPSDY